jgi:hypothetical protein
MPSPRRALHERTKSQTNEYTPASVIRPANEKEDIDFYSTTPYPTKPAQVLLPKPGKGQGFAEERSFGVSDLSLGPAETPHSATGHVENDRDVDTGMSNAWELSSSVDVGNSSSQVWGEDPKSSRSSFPDPGPADEDDTYDHKTVSGLPFTSPEVQADDDNDVNEEDDVIILPTVRATVKTVLPSSPRAGSVDDFSGSSPIIPDDHSSSPNVVPVGLPSSPNFVSLESSSPNLIPIGSSSPNIVTVKRSDPSIASSSSNSLGTVVRTYNTAADWTGPSSEGANSQSGSFHSSPPEQLLRLYRSASSLALPPAVSSRNRSGTTSTGSIRSVSDVQVVLDSGTSVQYPTIRTPSSSISYAESAPQGSGVKRPSQVMTEASSGGWNPRLSTVPSQWSEERKLSEPSTSASSGKLETNRLRSKTASTIWIVDEGSADENLDSLSNLPRSPLRHVSSHLLGSNFSESRSNSLRSLGRPGSSSSSVLLNALPNWVRLYYRTEGPVPQVSYLDSRPSSRSRPASPARYLSQVPTSISRPRTRRRDNTGNPPRLIDQHPADPRSHWRRPHMDEIMEGERFPSDQYPSRWSPHLHPDKGEENQRHTWVAPSLDSTREPFFGRRNVQIYSFCLGFVFPLGKILKLRSGRALLTDDLSSLAHRCLPPSAPET